MNREERGVQMAFQLSKMETENIVNRFGQAFYEKVIRDLSFYAKKWKLEIESCIDYYSVNCIFICRSALFGPAVLKIGNPSREVRTEANLLKEYNGGRFCKMYDCDLENGVILEEYIYPGKRLREEQSLERRLEIFSNLFHGLHIESSQNELYPTYFDWVDRIAVYMSKREDYPELRGQMLKARELCSSLCMAYPKKLLLHGDLHHDNILLGEDGAYKIIDPKGVIGDPIFDIPRFILNEFYDRDDVPYELYSKHIETISSYFEKSVGVPKDVVLKCVYIETAMANCWNVEDNEEPNMRYVLYAEAMMD